MFEAEVEMEKRTSSWVPLLLILVLAASILGVAGYLLYDVRSRKDLTASEAAPIAAALLKAQGPAVVHFHVGLVAPSVDEKPQDPHYRLLAKAGVIKLSKAAGGASQVSITPAGERELAGLPELQRSKNPDGTESYVVPLAARQLVQVSKVTMQGSNMARVEYLWKWVPNQLGEDFDASGTMVKSFNTWDRATLIQKYGADFFHGEPTRTTVTLMRADKGWKLATE